MKNDLNFAQNIVTLPNDQCRPVRGTLPKREVTRSLSGIEVHRNRAFAVTKLTSTPSFMSFMSFTSFDLDAINIWMTKTEEGIGIWGENWGMKNVPGAWCL